MTRPVSRLPLVPPLIKRTQTGQSPVLRNDGVQLVEARRSNVFFAREERATSLLRTRLAFDPFAFGIVVPGVNGVPSTTLWTVAGEPYTIPLRELDGYHVFGHRWAEWTRATRLSFEALRASLGGLQQDVPLFDLLIEQGHSGLDDILAAGDPDAVGDPDKLIVHSPSLSRARYATLVQSPGNVALYAAMRLYSGADEVATAQGWNHILLRDAMPVDPTHALV